MNIFEKNLRKISNFETTPSGWADTQIKSICLLGRGRVISQDEINQHPGQYPVYSSQTSDDGILGYLDTYDFDDEILTWTTDGANAGTVFYRKGKFNCTNVCGTIKSKESNKVDLKFLHYHLGRVSKSYVSYLGNPKLMNDVMANIAIPIPNIYKQRKIARILTTVDNLIERTEELIAKQESIKQGMMHDLFTRGVDENGQLRPTCEEAPNLYKSSELGMIPKTWKVEKLGDITDITKLAGFEFTNYFDYETGGEIVALRALNIKNERLDLTNIQTIPKSISEKLPRSRVYAEDVLITYIGAYIGDVLLINESDKFHLAPNVAKITTHRSTNPHYLELIMRTSQIKTQMFMLYCGNSNPQFNNDSDSKIINKYPKWPGRTNKNSADIGDDE